MSHLLSVLSFIASFLYFHVGFYTYRQNKKSVLGRTFIILTTSMAIWSFSFGFIYITDSYLEYCFWNKLSAFGWCTFSAYILYLILLITENKFVNHWLGKAIVLFPAALFLYMALFLFGPYIQPNPMVETFFYTGYSCYIYLYQFLSIVLMFLWGRKQKSLNLKKQGYIIAITGAIPFLINFIAQVLLPLVGQSNIPNMGHLYSLIMLWGVHHAIIKYRFISIPTDLITNELFNELSGLSLLVDTNGMIIKANRQSYDILSYKENELVNHTVDSVLTDSQLVQYISNPDLLIAPIKIEEVYIASKSGTRIPFQLTLTPMFDPKTNLFLGLLVIGQDLRTTKVLQDEIIKHNTTFDKLRNSEELFRTMVEIIPISIVLSSKKENKILYANSSALEFFKVPKTDFIGSSSYSYYKSVEIRQKLIDDNKQNIPVKERETVFLRGDGTEIHGLISMVSAFFLDEEVVLACISDITEIEKMNQELRIMNDMLTNKSIRDSLTNLYNHQYINELLEEEIDKISNANDSLCVMMMDIDFFKRVNDTFGHQAGDKVLIDISNLIIYHVNGLELFGRYGGEEFIAILPQIQLEDAYQIAEEIRKRVQDYDFGLPGLKVTLSIGLTQYNSEDGKSLINRADALLYQAKRNGRNRIEYLINNHYFIREL